MIDQRKCASGIAKALGEAASEYEDIDELGDIEHLAVVVADRLKLTQQERDHFYAEAGLPFLLARA